MDGIDRDRVAAIRDERIDWRFKGLPASAAGLTLAELADRRLDLFRDDFLGPVVVLDADALEHNLRTMADWCAAAGVSLAPHGKTTMAPQLFARQLDHGAWGITAANASQLRVYRAFRVRRVLLANQLVDPAALRWLAAELAADPDFEFTCWVDSVRGVALMTEALAGAARPVDVLVEVGRAGCRTGVRDRAAGRAVAEAVAASPALRLVGVAGYEGAVAHGSDPAALSAVDEFLRELRALALDLREHWAGLPEVIVTAGGSAYFDQAAAVLTEPWPAGLPVRVVLRSGAYLSHDDGHYRELSPLGRTAGATPFRPALRAWAQVTSRPQADLALLTCGKRDVPYDLDLPEPQLLRTEAGTAPLVGHRIRALNDQHAFLELPADSPVRVGDWVGLGVSHPCTAFDKQPLLPVVSGSTVVDLVRTYF